MGSVVYDVTSSDLTRYFSWQDYTVFAAMLVVSALIGVYHGFSWRKKPEKTPGGQDVDGAGEFLTAGGQMSTIPVALSLLAG